MVCPSMSTGGFPERATIVVLTDDIAFRGIVKNGRSADRTQASSGACGALMNHSESSKCNKLEGLHAGCEYRMWVNAKGTGGCAAALVCCQQAYLYVDIEASPRHLL